MPTTRRQRHQLITIAIEQRTRTDNQRACLAFDKGAESGFELTIVANFCDSKLPPDGGCRCKHVAQHPLTHYGTRVRKVSDHRRLRSQIAQKSRWPPLGRGK